MAEDYYKILGASRTSTAEEISKAYRKLARKHHPDLNPDDQGAKKRFQEIQKAYDVLNDPEKRRMYDQYGENYEQVVTGGGPFGGGQQVDLGDLFGRGGAAFGGMDLNDIFAQFTAGPRRGKGPTAAASGATVQAEVTIPFQMSIQGGETSISVDHGQGTTETIHVKIPAGIEDGKKMRLRGKGQAGRGGAAGDLVLTIRVASHPHYRREGGNLELRLPVSLSEAVLGAKVNVPTPAGIVSLKLPEMCSSGQRLRVKGQGVRTRDGSVGDLVVEVLIKLPKSLDEPTRKAIAQMDLDSGSTLRSGLSW
jgi:DnaJ-class molecular chaperone